MKIVFLTLVIALSWTTITLANDEKEQDEKSEAKSIEERQAEILAPLEDDILPPLYNDGFKDKMMKLVIRSFWQDAIDINGKKMTPYSDYERTTPLLNADQGYQVIDQGYYAGMAKWCEVEFKNYLHKSMEWGRTAYQWNVKRSAYAAKLFGISKDFTIQNMEKLNTECNEDMQRFLKKAMTESLNVPILEQNSLIESNNK